MAVLRGTDSVHVGSCYAAFGLSPAAFVRKLGVAEGERMYAAWQRWNDEHGAAFRAGEDALPPPGADVLDVFPRPMR